MPIVWHHSTTHPMDGVLGRGPLGVDLFFAVSGFLITSLLLHERRQAAEDSYGHIALGRFWIRRSLRIFPLYYLVLGAFVLHAVFARPPGPVRDYFLHSVPYYATYTSNWFLYEAVDHPIVFAFAWSLATEEQFYLVWPPLLRAARGHLVPALVMGALIALDQSAERGWLSPVLGNGLALNVARSFATPIGLGALLALAADWPPGARVCDAIFGHRWSSAIAIAFVGVGLVRAWPLFPTHLALAALVFACARRRDHVLAPLFANRIVQHVGTVSYGVYLLNVPIVSAVRRLVATQGEANAALVFVVAMTASVLVASLTYRYIERPFLRLRDRFRGA
jgi:peptidoglycan/LPS O-acetylase OafA/YrhL